MITEEANLTAKSLCGERVVEATNEYQMEDMSRTRILHRAALKSLALPENPQVASEPVAKVNDDKNVVGYTAAGAIIRLSELKPPPVSAKKHPK